MAGVFVRDAVEHLRAAGVEVEVVSPASFRHFWIAYGHGVVGNLRRRPWLALLLPLFLLSYTRAARRAARDADLVHAHWLPSALPALLTRKPFVVQLWGTDVELARRAPWAFRWLVRRARIVLCPSSALVEAARLLGARETAIVGSGVVIPDEVMEPADAAARPVRRPALRGEGNSRAGRGHGGDPAGDRRRRAVALPCSRQRRVRSSERARSVLRARSRRRLPVAPRGLRRRRPGGDGLRAARRRIRCRRPHGRRRGRRHRDPRAPAGYGGASGRDRATARRSGAAAPARRGGRELARRSSRGSTRRPRSSARTALRSTSAETVVGADPPLDRPAPSVLRTRPARRRRSDGRRAPAT